MCVCIYRIRDFHVYKVHDRHTYILVYTTSAHTYIHVIGNVMGYEDVDDVFFLV